MRVVLYLLIQKEQQAVCIPFNFLSADNFVLCACAISLSQASVDTVFYSYLDLSIVVSISVCVNQFTKRNKGNVYVITEL